MDRWEELWKQRQEALEERDRICHAQDNLFYFIVGLVVGLALSAGFIMITVTIVH